MFDRVARTQSEPTAWRLIAFLTGRMPFLKLVVVQRAPGKGYELVPTTVVHPDERTDIHTLVTEFGQTQRR